VNSTQLISHKPFPFFRVRWNGEKDIPRLYKWGQQTVFHPRRIFQSGNQPAEKIKPGSQQEKSGQLDCLVNCRVTIALSKLNQNN
jgi:hypothetical protein